MLFQMVENEDAWDRLRCVVLGGGGPGGGSRWAGGVQGGGDEAVCGVVVQHTGADPARAVGHLRPATVRGAGAVVG